MSIFSKLLQRISNITFKHVVIGVVYLALLAGSISLGVAARGDSSAAVIRDGNVANNIDNSYANGGQGAADANELIADIPTVHDLAGIYNHFGLQSNEYDRFKQTAKWGMASRNGNVYVDNQVVLTNAWSIGRKPQSWQFPIQGVGNYHASYNKHVLGQDLPVLVMFGADGSAEFIVITACGNPTGGDKVKPSAVCNALNDTVDPNNPNKHTFTTNASFDKSSVSRVVYTIKEDGKAVKTVEKTSLTDGVTVTFSNDAEVSVQVYAKTPWGVEFKAGGDCVKKFKYQKPMYVCVSLTALPVDEQLRKFRFTVTTQQDANTTVKDVDFTLDSTVTTSGVTTKDNDGKIYKEYEFNDFKEHTVTVKVNFNTTEGVKSHSGDCKARVTAKEEPKCEVPGFEHLPPNDERCGYCKPGIPKGDARCEECKPGVPKGSPECQPLVETGPGNLAGLFAGTSLLGAAGHMAYRKVRASRRAE